MFQELQLRRTIRTVGKPRGTGVLANRAIHPAPPPVRVAEATDSRVVLFRGKRFRVHAEYQAQVRALAEQALGSSLPPQVPLNRMGCVVGVHYSRKCLQRLAAARSAGRGIVVHSAIVPSNASDEVIRLACAAAPVVYELSTDFYEAEFQREGSDQAPEAKTCSVVVAFPVQQPLEALRPPFVILDGLVASQNVGQILRTAYHLGVTSVIASRSAWNSITGRAARVSMGWLYFMDFHLADPLGETLQSLRTAGVMLYAAEDHHPEPVAPHLPAGDRNWALIVGHEDQGLSNESLAVCHKHVCVPQRMGESLNVAHAAAICLYELSRGMGE